MRALLLAAGLGTRLRPLTETLPKCLVPIKGHALLGIWLERLQRAGIGPFLINTHYLSGLVESFVEGSPHRDMVNLVHEPELKGTAGTLLQNLDFFGGEDAMLIHADNYCLADLSAFVRAHRNRPADCLMKPCTWLSPRPVPRPSPLVVKNGSNAREATSWGIPVPVSVTATRTYCPAETSGWACA